MLRVSPSHRADHRSIASALKAAGAVIVAAREVPPDFGEPFDEARWERWLAERVYDAEGRILGMYRRWAERSGLDAGYCGCIDPVLRVRGPGVFRRMGGEHGLHELVETPERRMLPPKVSRVRVEVLPEASRAGDLVIGPDELRVQVCPRNSEGGPLPPGATPGVHITHLPTGITAFCAGRQAAMALLHARLAHRPSRSPDAPVRTYVLGGRHPRVHDIATGIWNADTNRVLDGDIGDFLPR